MEKKVEVRVYETRMYCDCGGEIEFSGTSYTVGKTICIHYCAGCQARLEFECKYPFITYEPIETQENGK